MNAWRSRFVRPSAIFAGARSATAAFAASAVLVANNRVYASIAGNSASVMPTAELTTWRVLPPVWVCDEWINIASAGKPVAAPTASVIALVALVSVLIVSRAMIRAVFFPSETAIADASSGSRAPLINLFE